MFPLDFLSQPPVFPAAAAPVGDTWPLASRYYAPGALQAYWRQAAPAGRRRRAGGPGISWPPPQGRASARGRLPSSTLLTGISKVRLSSIVSEG